MAICVACHPRGTYTTATFRTAWAGRPLSDLFDLVREKMPKSDPGSLTPAEYAQAIAYLLKINDVPAGEQELPPEGEALKKIRIEWPDLGLRADRKRLRPERGAKSPRESERG